jgi:hypothetical protein
MPKEIGNVYGAKRTKQYTAEKGKGDREDYMIDLQLGKVIFYFSFCVYVIFCL